MNLDGVPAGCVGKTTPRFSPPTLKATCGIVQTRWRNSPLAETLWCQKGGLGSVFGCQRKPYYTSRTLNTRPPLTPTLVLDVQDVSRSVARKT